MPHDGNAIVDDRLEAEGGYRIPGTDHGTHVSGILAANLPMDRDFGKELTGMCPHLTLYDLRVFEPDGRGDEFAILCAVEFVGLAESRPRESGGTRREPVARSGA